MKRTRILLADDHPQIRELLRVILEPEFRVVGAAEDGETLLQYAQSLQPDVIISDINMPKVDGLQAARLLKDIAPHSRVIFLTAHAESSYVDAAFAAGAVGYLIKGATTDLVGSLRSLIDSVRAQNIAPSIPPRPARPSAPATGVRPAH
ncbi:MAG: response regulator transcription factor [Nitrospira sp.]|nr:response regulator transcription factor [Nitrospira sp.]